jgi:hypothetical protein
LDDPSRHFATANSPLRKLYSINSSAIASKSRWNGKPYRFCGSHIDDEVELGRLHDRKLARFLAF